MSYKNGPMAICIGCCREQALTYLSTAQSTLQYCCMCHTLICFTCLCACLHPPSRSRPPSLLSPVHLYLCSLFVCCQFVLSCQAYQRVFRTPLSTCFLVILVLIILPALTLNLPAVLYLLILPCITDLCLPLTCHLLFYKYMYVIQTFWVLS